MTPFAKYAGLIVGAILAAMRVNAQPPTGGLGEFGNSGRAGAFSGNTSWVRIEGGATINEDTVRTARETATHSVGLPNWKNEPGFGADVFTFTRLVFKSNRRGRGIERLGWWIDYPDADLNLSARLQQLTSMKVDPDARVVRLTDPDIYRYPFLYAVHVEGMALEPSEAAVLSKYLRTGGALMVSDFWGDQAWANFSAEMQKVLPGIPWVDLPPDHPVFHGVFDLKLPLSNLQVPTVEAGYWNRNYDPADPDSRATNYRGVGSADMHVRAWLDAKGRIMVIALHNTDISDGWEREGENAEFFRQFAEPRAYPLVINILFYLMSH